MVHVVQRAGRAAHDPGPPACCPRHVGNENSVLKVKVEITK
jgi:hypothetical protein